MASTQLVVDTQHQDMIHDVQSDYYGKCFATASSDRTVRIFNAADGALLKELTGHTGPVWQVSWAHPRFGTILADCSYDGRVYIWKEENPGNWIKIFEGQCEASVNSVSWAPQSVGLCLAAACADGSIYIYTYQEAARAFHTDRFEAHLGGVNSVSWAPDLPAGALLAGNQQPNRLVKRLVSGGCDNRVAIWNFDESHQKWEEDKKAIDTFSKDGSAAPHGDWVRDVAWAPSIGLPSNTIASASEDQSVIIWAEDPTGVFKKAHVLRFDTKVWRVSWSVMGNVLAVSQGDNKVSLWKESLDGSWKNLTSVSEPDASGAPQQ